MVVLFELSVCRHGSGVPEALPQYRGLELGSIALSNLACDMGVGLPASKLPLVMSVDRMLSWPVAKFPVITLPVMMSGTVRPSSWGSCER
jgi:hypothetical protein